MREQIGKVGKAAYHSITPTKIFVVLASAVAIYGAVKQLYSVFKGCASACSNFDMYQYRTARPRDISQPRQNNYDAVPLQSTGVQADATTQTAYTTILQGDNGRVPQPKPGGERDNVWYRDEYELTSFDIPRASLSTKGMARGEFVQVIKRNLVCALIKNEDNTKVMQFKMMCLKGNVYLANNHCIPPLDGPREICYLMEVAKDGVAENIITYIHERDLVRFPEKDLVLISIKCVPNKRGIFKYLPERDVDLKVNGFYVHRDIDGKIQTNDLSRFEVCREARCQRLVEYHHTTIFATSKYKTDVGWCGSAMVADTPHGYMVVGFHYVGTLDDSPSLRVGSVMLTQDMLERYIEHEMTPLPPLMEAPSVSRTLTDLHHKSPFRFIDDGLGEVYGSIEGFRSSQKSKVCKTPMNAFLAENYGLKQEFTAPCMSGWEPKRIALLDMVMPPTKFDTEIIRICRDSFLADILDSLSMSDIGYIEIYDDFTAVNGAQGVAYVDRINRNTSAGFPWRKSKKHFIRKIPPQQGLQHPIEFTDEIMERVRYIIGEYETGNTVSPVFVASLKDEPVSFKKAEAKKTRVFSAAPVDWSIVVRKYFLSFIRVLQNNRYVFEAAPGTVAQSLEWDEMYYYITRFGNHRIIAGGYSKFVHLSLLL